MLLLDNASILYFLYRLYVYIEGNLLSNGENSSSTYGHSTYIHSCTDAHLHTFKKPILSSKHYSSERHRSCTHPEPTVDFPHLPLTLGSTLLSVRGPQSRFPMLINPDESLPSVLWETKAEASQYIGQYMFHQPLCSQVLTKHLIHQAGTEPWFKELTAPWGRQITSFLTQPEWGGVSRSRFKKRQCLC